MGIPDDIRRLESVVDGDPQAQQELDRLLVRVGLPKRRIAKLLESKDLPALYVDEVGRIVHASALTNLWTDAAGRTWGRFDATTAPEEIVVPWQQIEEAYTLPEVALKEWSVPTKGWRGKVLLERMPDSRYRVVLLGPNDARQAVAEKDWDEFASFNFVHHELRPLSGVLQEYEDKGISLDDVISGSDDSVGIGAFAPIGVSSMLTKWAVGFALVGIITGIVVGVTVDD